MQRNAVFWIVAFVAWGLIFTLLPPAPLGRGLWLLLLMVGGPTAFFLAGNGR